MMIIPELSCVDLRNVIQTLGVTPGVPHTGWAPLSDVAFPSTRAAISELLEGSYYHLGVGVLSSYSRGAVVLGGDLLELGQGTNRLIM